MHKSGLLSILIVLDCLIGSMSGYVLWPICASAFHGPFESPGYVIAWPVSIVISLIPVSYFISAFLLMRRKKAGFTLLFMANALLLTVLVLFSAYMHLVVVSSKVNVPEARIIPLVYLSTVSVFVFSLLSVWVFTRKRVRAILKDTK